MQRSQLNGEEIEGRAMASHNALFGDKPNAPRVKGPLDDSAWHRVPQEKVDNPFKPEGWQEADKYLAEARAELSKLPGRADMFEVD